MNATLASDGTTATGTINDGDAAPELSIADATAVTEGASATFVVSMAASEKQVEVSYATEDGTAGQPGDYTSVSGTLTFAAGDTAKTVTVATVDDAVDEADETFTVKLSAPVNATLASDGTTATGTINDNDNPAVLAITDARPVTEGASASFVVGMGASEKQVEVSYATEDGTAGQPEDYTSVSGTLTFEAGDTTKTVTVATVDDAVDEADETFTVKLSAPVNATLASDGTTATGTINDGDAAPELSIADATAVTEGASATFVVSMAASGKQVEVSYATEDGTAGQPEDYTSVSGTLTFEAGDTTKTVTVATVDDAVDEADETFTVKLSAPVNATLASDGTTATGTINDGDAAPELSIADATAVTEGASATFVVSMAASEKQVEVSYATEDGTAGQPGDYTSVSGTLTFAAGDTAKTVTVATVDDAVDEADETFTVKLSAPVNATLASDGTTATGTINDGDAAPELSIADATAVTEGASATFVVSMAASEKQVEVSYATEDGTAGQPGDYTSVSGTLTFAAGDTAKTVTVATVDDAVDEADETFTVKLSAPVNATLASDGTTATGTINDEATRRSRCRSLSITDATGR